MQTTSHINSLGAFLLIYNCLNALLLLSMFYQFGNRENWLHATDPTVSQTQAKAPLWLYILHPFLELLLGVLSSIWACIPKMRTICRKEPVKPIPVYKPPTHIKYQQNPYHGASYQTICPPNSCVSSMISMSTLTKNTLNSRKYPQYSASQYCHSSHGRRSRSSYRMPPGMIGTETVL